MWFLWLKKLLKKCYDFLIWTLLFSIIFICLTVHVIESSREKRVARMHVSATNEFLVKKLLICNSKSPCKTLVECCVAMIQFKRCVASDRLVLDSVSPYMKYPTLMRKKIVGIQILPHKYRPKCCCWCKRFANCLFSVIYETFSGVFLLNEIWSNSLLNDVHK